MMSSRESEHSDMLFLRDHEYAQQQSGDFLRRMKETVHHGVSRLDSSILLAKTEYERKQTFNEKTLTDLCSMECPDEKVVLVVRDMMADDLETYTETKAGLEESIKDHPDGIHRSNKGKRTKVTRQARYF